MTRENLREGAKIIVHGNDRMEANNLAQSICEEKGVSFVHPFDHQNIVLDVYIGIKK